MEIFERIRYARDQALAAERTERQRLADADNADLQTVKIDGQEVRIPRRLVKAAQTGLIDVEQF